MSLSNILKGILNIQKKIDVSKLPSQGLFYKDGFEIRIKKAEMEDIIEYEYEYEKEDLGLVITRVKRVVENNVILSKGFDYSDIKSADIVYLFLEIVKFTNNKTINIKYFDDSIGENSTIQFDSMNFNYMKLGDDLMKYYDKETKEFVINGFRYSLPCIGVENSLTNFLVSKSCEENAEVYNDYSYDFLYFLGHKPRLSFSEIDNLIQIFNFDLSDDDKERVRKIIKSLSRFGKYSLKKNSRVIDVTAKIDLEKIWRI